MEAKLAPLQQTKTTQDAVVHPGHKIPSSGAVENEGATILMSSTGVQNVSVDTLNVREIQDEVLNSAKEVSQTSSKAPLQVEATESQRLHEEELCQQQTPEQNFARKSGEEMHRPSVSTFQDPVEFLKSMIDFRKATEKGFSVHEATSSLRKVSPSLVSLVLKKKRKITLDRADEFSKLMQLNTREKIYFRSWISRLENANSRGEAADGNPTEWSFTEDPSKNRKEVGTHLLNDWINVYVKDCFQLPEVQKNPELVHQYLASHAEPQRIQKSLEFLLREGYLRKTMDGRIVVETNLATANAEVPSKKIRQFHKGAFAVAKSALDLFPPSERLANTLIVPLNSKSYAELNELIQEFSEKLQEFAANNHEPGERLYQLILNLCPTGGKVE